MIAFSISGYQNLSPNLDISHDLMYNRKAGFPG